MNFLPSLRKVSDIFKFLIFVGRMFHTVGPVYEKPSQFFPGFLYFFWGLLSLSLPLLPTPLTKPQRPVHVHFSEKLIVSVKQIWVGEEYLRSKKRI